MSNLQSLLHQIIQDASFKSQKDVFQEARNQELYETPIYARQTDPMISSTTPWKNDSKYFQKAYISALALTKMAIHANSGGSIEVMGMMTGRIINQAIIVVDAYALPVEGTETRVNAQVEGYEYMVQYLESLKQSGRDENIVGWYHSHPGYGCWLSGIDVATQNLNQSFQDPYLAVVVDPVMTAQQHKVEIGAFRTYPDSKKEKAIDNRRSSTGIPKGKRQDYGAHADRYYSLDIVIYKLKYDSQILDLLLKKDWVSNLIESSLAKRISDLEQIEYIQELVENLKVKDKKAANLRLWKIHQRFKKSFEEEIDDALQSGFEMSVRKDNDLQASRVEIGESDMDDDESNDTDNAKTLDMSDDAISMESSSVHNMARPDEPHYENEPLRRIISERSRASPLRHELAQTNERLRLQTKEQTSASLSKVSKLSSRVVQGDINDLILQDTNERIFM